MTFDDAKIAYPTHAAKIQAYVDRFIPPDANGGQPGLSEILDLTIGPDYVDVEYTYQPAIVRCKARHLRSDL